jgi:hypothetical protein
MGCLLLDSSLQNLLTTGVAFGNKAGKLSTHSYFINFLCGENLLSLSDNDIK